MSRKASIKDVARKAGVSTATVSYVLNDSRPVPEATRKRVLQAAKHLNYLPSATARGLQARKSYLIGYSWRPLPPRNSSPILDRFIHSMGQAAYRAGYHLLAFPAPSDEDEVTVYRELVASKRVDGIILSATNVRDARVEYLMQSGMPFAAFGRAGTEYDYPWVDVDGRSGVQLAVSHLCQEGHHKIALLAWPPGSQSGEDRFHGYEDGLRTAGIPLREEWIVRVAHDAREGYRGMKTLLKLPPTQRPTAVVCVSDLIALGAMNAIQAEGLQVGPDIGVVGFDDMPLAESLPTPLTTVHQPVDEIGRRVVSQLMTLIEGKPLPPSEAHVLLQPRLVIRASTKKGDTVAGM